eukprot:TRINITY_DN3911_c0_g1_i1.p1 TRINITY_DN3911_c0_g1~~TRINITY_DN3911_c0_g1_i1.p1  ORF type:complete len:808 (+),score=265.81 TRINITY_DN3911_c0_g1_i1:87-2510(+)
MAHTESSLHSSFSPAKFSYPKKTTDKRAKPEFTSDQDLSIKGKKKKDIEESLNLTHWMLRTLVNFSSLKFFQFVKKNFLDLNFLSHDFLPMINDERPHQSENDFQYINDWASYLDLLDRKDLLVNPDVFITENEANEDELTSKSREITKFLRDVAETLQTKQRLDEMKFNGTIPELNVQDHVRQLRKENKRLGATIVELERRLNENQKTQSQDSDSVDESSEGAKLDQHKLQDLTDKIARLEAELASSSQKSALDQQTIQNLEQQLQAKPVEEESKEKSLEEIEKAKEQNLVEERFTQLNEHVTKLRGDLDQREVEARDAKRKIEELSEQINTEEEAIENLKRDLADRDDQLTRTREQARLDQEKIEQLTNQISQGGAQDDQDRDRDQDGEAKEKLLRTVQDLETELAGEKERRENSDRELEKARTELERLEAKSSENENGLAQTNDLYERTRSEKERLQSELQETSLQLKAAQDQRQDTINEVRPLQKQIQDLEHQLREKDDNTKKERPNETTPASHGSETREDNKKKNDDSQDQLFNKKLKELQEELAASQNELQLAAKERAHAIQAFEQLLAQQKFLIDRNNEMNMQLSFFNRRVLELEPYVGQVQRLEQQFESNSFQLQTQIDSLRLELNQKDAEYRALAKLKDEFKSQAQIERELIYRELLLEKNETERLRDENQSIKREIEERQQETESSFSLLLSTRAAADLRAKTLDLRILRADSYISLLKTRLDELQNTTPLAIIQPLPSSGRSLSPYLFMIVALLVMLGAIFYEKTWVHFLNSVTDTFFETFPLNSYFSSRPTQCPI